MPEPSAPEPSAPEPSASVAPRLTGVLVTYRRPPHVAEMVRVLAAQTRPLDALVVVDNDADPRVEELVTAIANAVYVAAPENLGPAGGIAAGMTRILVDAGDEDWILTLDDDDPPPEPGTLERLLAFAIETAASDPKTAAVGNDGVRMDFRRGRVATIAGDELDGPVRIDAIGGDRLPCYSVRAVRAVGPFRADLFFGFEELEFGLRLRRAGWSLYADGAALRRDREHRRAVATPPVPRRSLDPVSWRRYYSLRNLIVILRDHGHAATAGRVTIVVGLGKPVANLVRQPRLALAYLRLNVRACRDGWTGRLGRRVEPPTGPELASRKG